MRFSISMELKCTEDRLQIWVSRFEFLVLWFRFNVLLYKTQFANQKNQKTKIKVVKHVVQAMKHSALIPAEIIEQRILLIRGQKVMLGFHLAELYGVETRVINQAVK